jgi:hypothetical protein
MSEHEAVTPAPAEDPGGSGTDRMRELLADKRAVALIGAAALAVILLIAFVAVPALTGSSSSKPQARTPVRSAGAATSSTPSASASASATALPTVAAPIKVRNPFVPLAVDCACGSGGGSGSSAAGSASATAAPSSSAAATANAATLRQLTLVELSGPTTAKVTVNGLSFDVTKGTPFNGGFIMTAESAGTATFTYNGQTQTLVPGQYAFFS